MTYLFIIMYVTSFILVNEMGFVHVAFFGFLKLKTYLNNTSE